MQTIFDSATRDELLRRVDSIQPGAERQWGKMSAAQMLEHTARALEVATGRKPATQAFVSRRTLTRNRYRGQEAWVAARGLPA